MVANSERMVLAVVTGFEVYHMALLRGMREILSARNIPLLGFANYAHCRGDTAVDGGDTVPSSLAQILTHYRPQGVILTNSLSEAQSHALSRLLSSLEIPTVYLAQEVPDQVCVRADNIQGMRDLMAHLLDECGVRAPAMVRGQAHQVDHVVREAVFREEIERRGLTIHEDLFADGGGEREVTRNGLRVMLDRRRDMDAVVTTDDWCAAVAIEVLSEAGLRVPDDVLVTGFDDYPIATLRWPGITTVDQDLEGQGRLAARLLLESVSGTMVRTGTLAPCRLVVRGSTLRPTILTTTTHTSTGSARNAGAPSAARIAELAEFHITDHNAIFPPRRSRSGALSGQGAGT